MSRVKTVQEFNGKYLIYARKSTDDATSQKNSIEYQVLEIQKYAKANNLPIADVDIHNFCKNGIIAEHHTGFKEGAYLIQEKGKVQYEIDRPKFHHMAHLLHKRIFKGAIFLCWDRASRNDTDSNLLNRLQSDGVSILFVQADYADSSSGALHRDIDSTFAKHHSRVTSEKVTLTTRKLRNEGVCTYRAPIGYLNQGNPRHKPFDPVRAPIIRQMFEKYTEGTWSLAELAIWANRQGLTNPPMRRRRTDDERLGDETVEITPTSRPINFNNVHKILNNPFYKGLIIGNDGQLVQSISHQPLVDESLFDHVQEVLKQKTVSAHYIDKPYFHYRGVVRCGYCDRVYTPYEKKSTHYYGSRCQENCPNTLKSINTNLIEEKLGEKIKKLYYSDEELEEIDVGIRTNVNVIEAKRQSSTQEINNEKKRVREDLSYLHNNKLSLLRGGAFDPTSFIEEEMKLQSKLKELQEQEQLLDASVHEAVKDVVILSELLKDAYVYYSLANSSEKKQIISKIFSEIKLSQNGLEYKCKDGFKALENHSFALGDQRQRKLELTGYRAFAVAKAW